MVPILQSISEDQFLAFDFSRQLLADPNSRCFAQLSLGPTLGAVAFSWLSDAVAPALYFQESLQRLWIAVDQAYLALSTATGHVLLKNRLSTNFLKFHSCQDYIIILAESEICILNPDLTPYISQSLPDIAVNITSKNRDLEITLLDHTAVLIDLSTGQAHLKTPILNMMG